MSEATIGTVISGIRLDAEIGRGGMGVVYRGFQSALSRVVAVKVVRGTLAHDADFRERFRRECEIAASLEHPHIVPIHSADSEDGQLSVTMRFVDGPDLGAYLRSRGALEPAVAAEIVAQVAGALDTAHRRGLVHRDVKPANILVGETDGRPHTYLTDFGLSRASVDPRGLTGTGVLLGTPGYMAPEQYEGGQVDGRADVYALGCVLFQCLTGRMPFVRDSAPALMWAHFSEEPPALGSIVHGLPERLDAVIRGAMAKRPEDRCRTAGELARDLQAAVGGSGDRGTTTFVATTVPPPRQGGDPTSHPPRYFGPESHGAPTTVPPTGPSVGSSPWAGSPPRGGGPWAPFGQAPPPGPPPPSWPGAPGGADSARRRRSRWLTVGVPVAAVVLVAALVAAVVLFSSDSAGSIAGPAIPVGRNPVDVEPGAGAIWTANADDGTVSKIDPANGISQEFWVGGVPLELAVDAGGVWVDNYTDSVTRLDIATGAVTSVYTNQPAPISGIAAGDGFLWISHRDGNVVTRVDTARQAVDPAPPIPVGRAPVSLVYENHRLYVANTGDRTISVLDQNGQSMGPPITFSSDLGGIDADGGTLYVGTGDLDAPADRARFDVLPFDSASWVVGEPIALGRASWFDVQDGTGWAAYPLTNEIRRIDVGTRAPSGDPITGIGAGVGAMQVVGEELWVTNTQAHTVTRVHLEP